MKTPKITLKHLLLASTMCTVLTGVSASQTSLYTTPTQVAQCKASCLNTAEANGWEVLTKANLCISMWCH